MTGDHSIALTVLQLQFAKAIPDLTRVIRREDVRLADGRRRRIPDLVIVRESYHGSPTPASNVLLAVEVVSPGGGDEWGQKMIDYAEGGIPGYLIVEGPKDGRFTAAYHVLREDHYELVAKAEPDATFTITEPFTATIDLSELSY